MNPQSNMSNSFDGFLTNLGDVTVERVGGGGDAPDATKGVQADGEPMESKEMMDNRQTGNDDCSEDSTCDTSETGRRKKIAPMRTDEIEEIRTEGSADDMDLDETIDSHIGVRMETERQHIQSLLSDDNEDDDDEDEDIGIDSVNILDTLPLEGAPIEGQEVSEADLLGKMNDDDDDEEDKSLSRSGEEDSLDAGKRRGEHDDGMDPSKKKQKKDDGAEGSSELEASKCDKKLSNMRRNIREVMDETQLDEATLAAQRQEMERLRRVQEQQRIIREVQRRQASRGVSLLRSNQSEPNESEVRLPSTVMLKVNSVSAVGGVSSAGQQAMAARRPMAERWQRGRGIGAYQPHQQHQQAGAQTSISRVPARPGASNVLQQRIRMMTPSVSISPVVPKKEPIEHLEYYTDSDLSDVDAETDDVLVHEKQLQQARKISGVPKPGQKLAKGKDVVTISSSSESSDDDCIVLSDPSEVEETDNEDDPSNSGMHTNDRYNIPDEQGRVLVNVGHPEDEPDVFLAPQVARIIKPHQIGGIRFLYDNIVESIERFKTSSGFGCILAHSMGLGKTLQVASFCDIFFRCTSSKTVLCIMPINTLQNWLAEFNMWLPYEDPNKPKIEEKAKVKEESNLSNQDSAYVSRPGSEHDPNSQQQASGMMTPERNPYAPQHGFGPGMVPNYGPTGAMYDPRYGPMYPGPAGYSPIKTENPCHPQQMNPYGMDARGMPQYNPAYPSNMQQPPVYPGMDPNVHPGAHGMNPMYPGYGANPNVAPYSNMYPGHPRPDGQETKKMEGASTEHRPEGQAAVKAEPTEEPKKDPEEPKKENKEEKKDETVKTPYSVDAPLDLETRPRHFHLHILNDSHKTMAARARVIREWQKVGGVLLIGYELYRQLSLKKPNKAKRKRGQPQPFKDPSADAEEEDKNKPLLDEMHVALVNPGPDLVICDEGHRIKNSHASISLALKQMRTKRRIVLTGYPLQNNLLEYWCMVDFVRPNYLGTKSEFCNMFERPIQNGQCIDSTPQDIRLMRYRAHVLHALLEGFVQRRSHSVLQVSLPRKEEYILLVRMTAHQRKLYDTFMNQVVKTRAVPNPLKAFAVCCKIWNHPDILYHFLRKRQANEEDDLDLEETMGDKAASGGGAKRAAKPRQPKGEGGRKGKKANPKNKPAASVQPNVSTENPENAKSQPQQPPYQGQFNQPPGQTPSSAMVNSNASFPGANASNYQQQQQPPQQQQQHGNYQNYQSDERGNTYHGGEYDYYGNQNQQSQQKYQTPGAQNFQQYPQNTNYPNQTQQQQQQQQQPQQQQPQQQYQGQPQQNYDASASTGQRFAGPSAAGSSPAPGSANYRQEQNQQTPGSFPRQNYPYSGNLNQGQNYPAMQNQQSSNYQSQSQPPAQMNMSEYGSYPAPNAGQGYGNSTPNQSVQSNGMNYPSGQSSQNQSLSNSQANSNYMGSQQQNPAPGASGFNQNQQMQNAQHQQYPNAAATANPNQALSYPASGMAYNSSQQQPQQQQMQTNQQQHGYQSNAQQNQMRGYQNLSQAQTPGYNQQSQQHVYPSDPQQQQQPPQQTQHQQSSQQHHSQQHGFNQQTSNYSPTSQVPPNQMGYSPNQQGSAAPYQANAQQSQTPSHAQNQSMNYSQNTPVRVIKTEPQQQQQQQHGYSRSDSQTGYPNPSQGFPPTNPQMPPGSQVSGTQQQPSAQGQEQYWQRNYQNSNDQAYYNDPNVSQYQGNYQGTAPGNYQNQQNQYRDYSANALIDQKPPQQQQQQQQQQTQPQQQQSHMSTTGQPTQSLQVSPPNPPYGAPVVPALGNQAPGEPIKEEDKERDSAMIDRDKTVDKDKEREDKSDDEIIIKDEAEKEKSLIGLGGLTGKEDPGIPYDWATELMKGYVPGLIDASAKMTLFFCILEEAIKLGDRVLAFSQSLFTLNLIEDFLARNNFKYKDGQTEAWQKNVNYYRLDGSTSALEREKLINEFNVNPKVHLFLVSTRAGSLGINLVGANRAIVFDASWNPCHDTQAVCRVYRYGQQKNCYVYRLVTDNCLERKIYDRQISKQGMADRVVDQCNPDAHLSLKEATTLSWDWEEDSQVQDFSDAKDKYTDEVMHLVLTEHSSLLTKQPFHHESLLVDRKDKKLSQAEKRLARRGYELEKMAANCSRPSYNYVPGNTAARVSVSSGSLQIRQIRGDGGGPAPKPVASVRPMQQRGAEGLNARNPAGSRWIPAEVWQRQGMSAQEMTLPLDVVIPTNSPDKGSIVLKAGQRVMVLKSPKGIYMQLESGKIIAIRTALKINQQKKEEELPKKSVTPAPQRNMGKQEVGFPLRNNSAISIIPKSSASNSQAQQNRSLVKTGANYRPFGEKEVAKRARPVATATAKPYSSQLNSSQVSLSRISKSKQDQTSDVGSMGENSNSSDGHRVRSEQRVEEVRIEDVVAETGSSSEYSPSSRPANSDVETGMTMPRSLMDGGKASSNFSLETSPARPPTMRTPQDAYAHEPKFAPQKKFDLSRGPIQKERKNDTSDEIIIEEPVQPHQLHQPHLGHHHSQHLPQHQTPHPPQHQPQHSLHQPLHQIQHQSQHQPPQPTQHQPQQTQQHPPVHPSVHQPVHQPVPQHPHSTRTPSRPASQQGPRITSDISLGGGKNLSAPANTSLTSPAVPTTPAVPSRSKPTPAPETASLRETPTSVEPAHGYPYAQYPRYYDYGDPRARPLTDPYGSYFPPAATARANPEVTPAPQTPQAKPVEETPKPVAESQAYSARINAMPPKTSSIPDVPEAPVLKDPTSGPAIAAAPPSIREDPHVPTAFSHPSSVRSTYPAPYPPTPYDPYSQHYPPAPASSAAYSAGTAPGYSAYGGPSYNADYARMYSAFHGPPPPGGDPYRSYAPPPASHPSNYYPPFPHPPPPYPNYSFLPPYPNPNVPTEPQPPAQ